MATEINRMSQTVEDAVSELIRIFLHRAQVVKDAESSPSSMSASCKFRL